MNLTDFYDAVESSPRWLGVGLSQDTAIVEDTGLRNAHVRIPLPTIADHDWPHLERAMDGQRPLQHISRVVGYYSRIENWNPSKLAERRDRNRGNYSIPPGLDPEEQ